MVFTFSCSLGPHKVVGPTHTHRCVQRDSRFASVLSRLFWEETAFVHACRPCHKDGDLRAPQPRGGAKMHCYKWVQTAEGEEDPKRWQRGTGLGIS